MSNPKPSFISPGPNLDLYLAEHVAGLTVEGVNVITTTYRLDRPGGKVEELQRRQSPPPYSTDHEQALRLRDLVLSRAGGRFSEPTAERERFRNAAAYLAWRLDQAKAWNLSGRDEAALICAGILEGLGLPVQVTGVRPALSE